MDKPTVVILGASADRRKYGNKSVRAHLQQGYDVYPVNLQADRIEGLKTYPTIAEVPCERPDRISVYLPSRVGLTLLQEIRDKNADQVWFNPGSDSAELLQRAREFGLNVVVGCSIVDVGISPTDLPDE